MTKHVWFEEYPQRRRDRDKDEGPASPGRPLRYHCRICGLVAQREKGKTIFDHLFPCRGLTI